MLPAISGAHHAPYCPGFCGRYSLHNSTQLWTQCGACAWGDRSSASQCVPCDSPLSLYDWLFLAFMALLPLMAHCFCIHYYTPKKSPRIHEVMELLCCVFEVVVAAVVSVLLFPPRWTFRLWGCDKTNVKEWYVALYNPVVDHIKTMRCSYEVVFPLYSLPFVFLLCLLVSIIIFRSLLYYFVLKRRRDARAYYQALLTLPKIMVLHALLAGLWYASYPFLVVLWSVCSNAIHIAMEGKAPVRDMIKRLLTSPLHITLMTINMMLLSFAIIAMSSFSSRSSFSVLSLLLVPLPPLFYVATIGLSHPTVLLDTGENDTTSRNSNVSSS